MTNDLLFGDCLDILRTLPDCSVDAVVTDPPYGLSFMGKKWDYDVPTVEVWVECLRVLKPGGHLLAFAGTRTQHRMAVRIEDGGFEIRDMIAWVYGSGFPKSLDVSKAVEAQALTGGSAPKNIRMLDMGTDYRPHELAGTEGYGDGRMSRGADTDRDFKKVAVLTTGEAQQWVGWGTALKPALEPITVARKPLIKTVAANVLAHGTGALNIDGCRVGGEPSPSAAMRASGRVPSSCKPGEYGDTIQNRITPERWQEARPGEQLGRWPANLIHDGSDEVVAGFPQTKSGTLTSDMNVKASSGWVGGSKADRVKSTFIANEGSAARFFYCAKTSKSERGEANTHPTVKPTDLMRYLCRLVTPPGGIVLDPFMGSGSTGKAAILEGFRFVGVERDRDYMLIAEGRVGAKSDMPDWLR